MPPPREQPSPPNKRKRRPDAMPGSWLRRVSLVLLVAILYIALQPSSNTIDYQPDFIDLLKAKVVAKVTSIGKDPMKIVGEIKPDADLSKLKEPLRKKIEDKKKFSLTVPPYAEKSGGLQEALKKYEDQNRIEEYKEESGFSIGPILMLLLPALLLLAIFFLFLLPRFRDPMGGGFLSNYIKSPAKRYERNKMRVT